MIKRLVAFITWRKAENKRAKQLKEKQEFFRKHYINHDAEYVKACRYQRTLEADLRAYGCD